MKGKKGLSNRVLAALCFTMALVLLLSGLGATLARYVRSGKQQGVAQAAPFWFESDKLTENSGYYRISRPAEGEEVEITFSLFNYKDGQRCTQTAIPYECWVENVEGPIEGQEESGTLAGEDPAENEVKFTLQAADFDGGTVTVFATSASPYVKTLSAKFGFDTQDIALQWNVEEQEGAVVLEIYGGSGSPVTVTYPETLLADPYNELLEGVSGNSVTFTPQPGTRYALTFLKESGGTYNEDDFTVAEG